MKKLRISANDRKAEKMQLNELGVGKSAMIKAVGGEGALRQHLLDMGVITGFKVKIVKFAPVLSVRWGRPSQPRQPPEGKAGQFLTRMAGR